MATPVYAASAPAAQTLQVTCPQNMGPGCVIQIQVGAQTMSVTIPTGVMPGAAFVIQVPVRRPPPLLDMWFGGFDLPALGDQISWTWCLA